VLVDLATVSASGQDLTHGLTAGMDVALPEQAGALPVLCW
jgi:hypothetical protein